MCLTLDGSRALAVGPTDRRVRNSTEVGNGGRGIRHTSDGMPSHHPTQLGYTAVWLVRKSPVVFCVDFFCDFVTLGYGCENSHN